METVTGKIGLELMNKPGDNLANIKQNHEYRFSAESKEEIDVEKNKLGRYHTNRIKKIDFQFELRIRFRILQELCNIDTVAKAIDKPLTSRISYLKILPQDRSVVAQN